MHAEYCPCFQSSGSGCWLSESKTSYLTVQMHCQSPFQDIGTAVLQSDRHPITVRNRLHLLRSVHVRLRHLVLKRARPQGSYVREHVPTQSQTTTCLCRMVKCSANSSELQLFTGRIPEIGIVFEELHPPFEKWTAFRYRFRIANHTEMPFRPCHCNCSPVSTVRYG